MKERTIGIMVAAPGFYRKPIFSVTGASAVLAVVVWLAAKEAGALDQEMFNRLIVAFGGQQPGPEASQDFVFTLISYFLFGQAAVFAGFKLNAFARIIVGIQLFVVSLFFQWAAWKFFHFVGHPLGYSGVVFFGCLVGTSLRGLELQRRESESRYYELKIRNKELQETRLSLVKQDEIERRMLAADLHDQVLNDMKQLVQRFEAHVSEKGEGEEVPKVRSLAAKVMLEIREVMDSLCPSVLEHLGMLAAIEDCLRKGGERSGFKVRFRSKIDSDEFKCMSIVEQSLLYRLVQESVTNICKHAEAGIVRLTVDKDDDVLVITINDDGKGIDPSKMRLDSRGLKYMRLRADLIGATIAWKEGDNNRGTKVEIRVDLKGRQVVQGDE